MSGVQNLTVAEDDAGLRLDRWFKRHFPGLTHGRLEKLLRTGQVRVDGGRVKGNQRLEAGQTVRVPPLPDTGAVSKAKPKQKPPLDEKAVKELRAAVIHRDKHIIILNKPAGMAVQGGSKVRVHIDAMLDALRFDAKERPRLVHRLDKDTSGVMVIARTAKAAAQLTAAFRTKETRKIYWAAVMGVPRPHEGTINLPLAKMDGAGGEKVVGGEGGKPAVTHFRTIDVAAQKAAWLSMEPITGRTHQLRVHCAAIGTPIMGDGKYGGSEAFPDTKGIDPQLHLHARAIRLPHPAGGTFEISASLPPHMVKTWKFLGFDPHGDPEPFEEFDAALAQ